MQKRARLFWALWGYQSSVGDTTDIVTREMYDLWLVGDRHITSSVQKELHPLAVCVENKLFAPEVQKPSKVLPYGGTPCSLRASTGRAFAPVSTRLRWGFGSSNPATDDGNHRDGSPFLERITSTVKLHLNTLGNPESRAVYRQALTFIWRCLARPCLRIASVAWRKPLSGVLTPKEKEDNRWQWRMHRLSWISFDEESRLHLMRCVDVENLGVDYIIDTNMVRGLD